MSRYRLTEKENTEALAIVEKYRDIEKDLNVVQAQLLELDTKKEELLASLDENKKLEDQYFSRLSKKYGEGKLDLLTFDYVTKPKKK